MADGQYCDCHSGVLKEMKALRDLMDERKASTKEAIDLADRKLESRLAGMNEFQNRMDRLEGTFATKDSLDALARIVYIGVGGVLVIQIIKSWL